MDATTRKWVRKLVRCGRIHVFCWSSPFSIVKSGGGNAILSPTQRWGWVRTTNSENASLHDKVWNDFRKINDITNDFFSHSTVCLRALLTPINFLSAPLAQRVGLPRELFRWTWKQCLSGCPLAFLVKGSEESFPLWPHPVSPWYVSGSIQLPWGCASLRNAALGCESCVGKLIRTRGGDNLDSVYTGKLRFWDKKWEKKTHFAFRAHHTWPTNSTCVLHPDCYDVAVTPFLYQGWSLTQFRSPDFLESKIGVKKWVFNTRTIKVCGSCF